MRNRYIDNKHKLVSNVKTPRQNKSTHTHTYTQVHT